MEVEVFKGLQKGNEVLGEIQKEMSLDDVEKLMQDTSDAIAYQNEISNMLAGKITDEDEEDILEELNQITTEIEQQKIEELPSVPVAKVPEQPKVEVQEEEEERPREMLAA